MSDKSFVIADVFAEHAFGGNQLAVFVEASGIETPDMQRAANEIGFSETTFVLPPESDDTDLRLRIFTPKAELPFAGHPLVGSGFVAAAKRLVPCDPSVIRFGTGVGRIDVRAEVASNRHGRAQMVQPYPRLIRELDDEADLAGIAEALSLDRDAIAGSTPAAVMDNGLRMMIVPVASLAAVERIESNGHLVRRVCDRHDARTMLAFCLETLEPTSSVHCRVFAPAAGVAEDPATGSANGPLGVYLATYGLVSTDDFISEQGCEMGRPSRLHISLGRDAEGTLSSVQVGGGVFITGEASMFL